MRPSRAAAAVVVLVLAGLAVWASRSGTTGSSAPTTTTSDTTDLRSSPVAAHTSVPSVSGDTTSTTSVDDPEALIRAALDGWGRFAVTGDLAEVEPWFASDGPQMTRFRGEAQMIAVAPPGDPPYEVTFVPIDFSGDDQEQRIQAEVVFVRTGEPSQQFEWVFVVRRIEGRWWVWTVENAP